MGCVKKFKQKKEEIQTQLTYIEDLGRTPDVPHMKK